MTSKIHAVLHQQGTITLSNGQVRAALAYRDRGDEGVTVMYVSAPSSAPPITARRTATAKQAATFTAYAWRSYLSADDVHGEALTENLPGVDQAHADALAEHAARRDAELTTAERAAANDGLFPDRPTHMPISNCQIEGYGFDPLPPVWRAMDLPTA